MIAALFKEQFNVDWLADLTGCKATHLLSAFESRVASGHLASDGPGIYSFKDRTARARFLEGMDHDQEQSLHKRIACLLTEEAPGDNGWAASLSHHLLQITNDLDGCRHLVQAGDRHLKQYDNETAFQCYAKAIGDLSALSGRDTDRLFTETAVKYSKLSTARHDTAQVLSILYDALDRAAAMDHREAQVLLQMHIAKNQWLKARYTKALNSFEKGWAQAKAINDPGLLRTANNFSTFFLYWQGKFREVVENYEKSVPDVAKLPLGQFPLLAATTVGYCYTQIGQTTQGLGMLDTVRNCCTERGDLYLSSYAIGNMGAVMITIRHLEEALQYLSQANREAKQAHNHWVWIHTLIMKSYTHYLQGDAKTCIRDLKLFLKESTKVQATVQPYPYLMALAMAMEEGKLPRVRGVDLDSEIQKKLKGRNLHSKSLAYRYQSYKQRLTKAPVQEAVESLKSAMEWSTQSGHAIELARVKLDLARLYLCQGHKERAMQLADDGAGVLYRFNANLIPDDLRGLLSRSPRNNDIFNTVLKVTQEAASIRSYKDLMQHIISSVNRLTGAERGAVFFINSADGTMGVRGSRNITSAQISDPGFAESMALIEEVAKTGKGRIMESDPPEGSTAPGGERIRSRICVPMILRNKVTGVLYHDNRLLSSAFKAPHLELLAFLAAIAAIALDNATASREICRLNKKLNREKQYYEEEHIQSLNFKEIIGKSKGIGKVLSQIEHVAESDATVLITGETGVGKELVARAIHRLSQRNARPFIRVHCSALPENLIPSELFGHEKGAFTGASKRRVGRFELADTGSLFLDEMGEINPDIQTRLLRVLQTKEFERVGGAQTLRSDFRLIAATNRDLQEEVSQGRFRADLYYRLNVFPIHVPPLRDRKEDIPMLAAHFLHIHSKRMEKEFTGIERADLERLSYYNWPGNVRELENVIERACILSRGRYPRIPELTRECGPEARPSDGVTLKEVEERHLRWALEKTGWKVRGPGGTAELLDINPSTLRFRLKKHGITRPA